MDPASSERATPSSSSNAHWGRAPGLSGQQLPSTLLTAALCGALWLAAGGLLLAVLGGLGEHGARRLVIGLVLVLASAAALWRRREVATWLRARPWLVIPLAAAQLALAVVDGVHSSPYLAFCMTSVMLAVIVAKTRVVWLCAGSLVVACAMTMWIDRAAIADGRDLAGALGHLLSYLSVAGLLLGLRRLYTNFTARVGSRLEEIRAGAPALTPALSLAIERGAAPIALLPAPCPLRDLTPTERDVVYGLVRGRAPKQLAAERGVSLATIRTHIANAKRKTGARTMPGLVAIAARADGPVSRRWLHPG